MNKEKIASELLKIAKDLVSADKTAGCEKLPSGKMRDMCEKKKKEAATEKRYNTMMGVGRAKYVVNSHDGKKMHSDGSPFYDIALFSNKKVFGNYVKGLKQKGYSEE